MHRLLVEGDVTHQTCPGMPSDVATARSRLGMRGGRGRTISVPQPSSPTLWKTFSNKGPKFSARIRKNFSFMGENESPQALMTSGWHCATGVGSPAVSRRWQSGRAPRPIQGLIGGGTDVSGLVGLVRSTASRYRFCETDPALPCFTGAAALRN